jgi:hypothetical protein
MMGTHLTVKASDETRDVMLGPSNFISDKGFSFAKGDSIEVTGSKVTMRGTAHVIAREIVKDGKTLTLRDKRSTPQWAGGRMGAEAPTLIRIVPVTLAQHHRIEFEQARLYWKARVQTVERAVFNARYWNGDEDSISDSRILSRPGGNLLSPAGFFYKSVFKSANASVGHHILAGCLRRGSKSTCRWRLYGQRDAGPR